MTPAFKPPNFVGGFCRKIPDILAGAFSSWKFSHTLFTLFPRRKEPDGHASKGWSTLLHTDMQSCRRRDNRPLIPAHVIDGTGSPLKTTSTHSGMQGWHKLLRARLARSAQLPATNRSASHACAQRDHQKRTSERRWEARRLMH